MEMKFLSIPMPRHIWQNMSETEKADFQRGWKEASRKVLSLSEKEWKEQMDNEIKEKTWEEKVQYWKEKEKQAQNQLKCALSWEEQQWWSFVVKELNVLILSSEKT